MINKVALSISFCLFLAFTSFSQESVVIGSQSWMKKNLDVSTYSNGDTIPQVQDDNAWTQLISGAWRYYQNDSSSNSKFGKLYNWYAVNDPRGLAPKGWHVASYPEWFDLINYLCNNCGWPPSTLVGGSLKDITGWALPNAGANNSTGFSALGAGECWWNGTFRNKDSVGNWWTSTISGNTAWHCMLYYNHTNVVSNPNSNYRYGYSVRCIGDVYTFIGNGNWSDPSNWFNNLIPPVVLPSGAEIIINPAGSGECLLNFQQEISAGAKLRIIQGKQFKISGNLIIQH